MSKRRTTPLKLSKIEGHHCTVDLRLEKLSRVPFFSHLDSETLSKVHKQFNATHFAEGESIYFQDEIAAFLRVVVHGSVKLIRQTSDGKDILLDMLKPGEFFGSLAASGNAVYQETAIAQTNCCVLSIGMNAFRELLQTYPSVSVAVLDITAERLHSSQEIISQLTTLSVEKRIANILSALAMKFGEEIEDGILIQLPLSRKDLADMAGTSTETASRIMSRLQQDGIITTGRQWVAVQDLKMLKSAAEEN